MHELRHLTLTCMNNNTYNMAAIHTRKDEMEEEDAELAERKHFQSVLNAFMFYRSDAVKRVRRSEKYFNALPPHHQQMLEDMKTQFVKLERCIEQNYKVVHLIVNNTFNMFENKNSDPINRAVLPASSFDMEKVKTTLRQIVRDWSSEGASERDVCYQPIVNELRNLYNVNNRCDASGIRVLVPGAGLGRLAFDIAQQGFSCQGNEFSFYMLFTAHFILNRCTEVNSHVIFPWIHQYCNNKSSDDQVRPVSFPDVNPGSLPPDTPFSMVAGDFLDIYRDPDYWDSICTVYFIDTASNILAYVEMIYNILKPGGYWINLGPLLYHFTDMPNESSIELSYDDFREVVLKFNFEIVKEEHDIPSTYTQNLRSMMKYEYQCVYFVARKSPTIVKTDNANHNNER